VCGLQAVSPSAKVKTESTMINEYSVATVSSNSNKTIQTSKFRILLVFYDSLTWFGRFGRASTYEMQAMVTGKAGAPGTIVLPATWQWSLKDK
jgi:hypothetical protein